MTTRQEIDKILSGCLQEHVVLYFRPSGPAGIFMRFTGLLKLSMRQPGKKSKEAVRYFVGEWKNGITFTADDVDEISPNRVEIHLKI
jgi:hypothetical protein